MTPERRRGLRGLIRHAKRRAAAVCADRRHRRGIIAAFGPVRAGMPHGTCRWCGLPCEPRRYWHPSCVPYYVAAQGRTVNTLGSLFDRTRYLIPVGPCESCGGNPPRVVRHAYGRPVEPPLLLPRGVECDHRVALSVARRRGPRALLRAVLPDNLRWLCRPCHVAKTTADRAELRRLERAPAPLLDE